MKTRTKLLSLIAALSAANAAFRVGLAWGPPNVKPTAFLVIIGGIVAGPIAGFIIGWLSIRMAIGGFLLTVIYDIGTAIVDSMVYRYPWMSAVMGLYVPFLMGGLSPYPFGLVHEVTTALLCGTIGPSLVSEIRKFYH